MSKIKQYTDWRTWWDGLRTNIIKCIGTTGTMWLGSNGAATIGIDALKDIGLNWKQAIGLFGVQIGLEVFRYIKDNQPKVITETETETVTTTKTVTETPKEQ